MRRSALLIVIGVMVVSASDAPAAAPPAADCDPPLAVVGWSRDGRRVAFDGTLNPRQVGVTGLGGGVVGIVNADGTRPRILSQLPFQHHEDADLGLLWAPDGRSFLYSREIAVGSYPM